MGNNLYLAYAWTKFGIKMYAQKPKRRGKARTHYPQGVMLSLKIKNLVFLLFEGETHYILPSYQNH